MCQKINSQLISWIFEQRKWKLVSVIIVIITAFCRHSLHSLLFINAFTLSTIDFVASTVCETITIITVTVIVLFTSTPSVQRKPKSIAGSHPWLDGFSMVIVETKNNINEKPEKYVENARMRVNLFFTFIKSPPGKFASVQ